MSGFYQTYKIKYQNWKNKIINKSMEDLEEEKILGSEWQKLGFEKTVAGFTYTFGLLIPQVLFGILLLPLIQYTNLRFPEITGFDAIAVGLFGALYTILDLNLEASVNRFVPQYAVSDPKKAMQYVSFFIKYQMWSGLFQITFVALFMFYYIIPSDPTFAYLAWYIIFISIKQYPSTLGTFKGLLDSFQYKNKSALVTFYRASILEPITQIGMGLVGLYFGSQNPAWGEMMGLALGWAIGGYIDDFFVFILGTYWLSKILDNFHIRIRDIYGNKIPKDVWKSALSYAFRLLPNTIFSSIFGFTGFMISVDYLPGYITYKGLTTQAGNLARVTTWSDDIINGSQPVLSEAYNNGKVNLAKFYIAQGLKYNTWMLMILGSINAIALPVIVQIAIPQFLPQAWSPIIQMIPFFILFFLWQPFNDIAAKMIYLSGHPEVNSYLGIIETILSVFFTFYFIIILNMGWLGLILILIPGQIFSLIVRWIYMTKKIIRLDGKFWKDIGWQTFVAPLLAGGVYSLTVLLMVTGFWNIIKIPFVGKDLFGLDGGLILIPGLILIASLFLMIFIVYLPLYSYLGGWDKRTLNIFRRSVGLSGPSIWLIWPMYRIFKKFHEKSPFKERGYMMIGEIADKELHELGKLRNKHMEKIDNSE